MLSVKKAREAIGSRLAAAAAATSAAATPVPTTAAIIRPSPVCTIAAGLCRLLCGLHAVEQEQLLRAIDLSNSIKICVENI